MDYMNEPVNKKNAMNVYMEGWLLKKKSNESTSLLFKSHNQRWFRLQDVQSMDRKELAVCYYQNQKEAEAKGWIYMKDVTAIIDDKKTFSIISFARTMLLEATTAAEHNSWLAELNRACPHLRRAESRESSASGAGAKDYQSPSGRPAAKGEEAGNNFSTLNQDALRNLDAKGTNNGNGSAIDRSVSLFSRHAQGEKNSFYNAQGKPNIMVTHTESGEENYQEHELIPLQPDLGRSTDSIGGLLDREQRNNGNNNHHNVIGRERDGHPPRPRTDSRGGSGNGSREPGASSRDVDDNASEGSGGRRSGSNHTHDDHRKHGYRHGGDATHRLHRHIAKDNLLPSSSMGQSSNLRRADPLDGDEYVPPQINNNNSSSRHSSRQGSAGSRDGQDRDREYHQYDDYHVEESRQPRYSRKDRGYDDDEEPDDELNEGQQNPAERRRKTGQTSSRKSPVDQEDEDDDVQDVSLRVRRRPSRQSREAEDDTNNTNSNENNSSNGPGSASGRDRRDSRSAFSEESTSETTGNGSNNNIGSSSSGGGNSSGLSLNRGLPKPSKKAPPPPTVAPPPRRARDTLLNDEDDEPGRSTSTAPMRRSIDEILFQQKSNSGNELSVKAEEKSSSPNTNNHDDEDDEEIDFKAEYARYSEQKGVSPDSSIGKPPKHLGSGSGSGRSSAPPPSSSPPVYNMPNHRNPQARAGTPPRPHGNAGLQADRDFVHENWDDEGENSHDVAADAKSVSGKGSDAKSGRQNTKINPTAAMADANWLEENFDD